MDPKTPARRDELLDEALEESFPASDPIALSATNRHANDVKPDAAQPAPRRPSKGRGRKRRT